MSVYISNHMDAICSECKEQCGVEYDDGTITYDGPEGNNLKHSFGEEWFSDCCNSDLIDECGNEFIPEIDEGDEG